MADPHVGTIQEDADHVEPVLLRRPPVAVDPDHGGSLQLLALPPVNGLHRTTKIGPPPRLHLDEGDRPVLLDHEVDIPMAVPEPALNHTPPVLPQPSLGYPLSELPEHLSSR